MEKHEGVGDVYAAHLSRLILHRVKSGGLRIKIRQTSVRQIGRLMVRG